SCLGGWITSRHRGVPRPWAGSPCHICPRAISETLTRSPHAPADLIGDVLFHGGIARYRRPISRGQVGFGFDGRLALCRGAGEGGAELDGGGESALDDGESLDQHFWRHHVGAVL